MVEKFNIGDIVRKKSGYDWPGIVVGVNTTSYFVTTYGVENRFFPGTVHIFPAKNLMFENRTTKEILEEIKERVLE